VFIETLENALGKKAVKKYLPMQAGEIYSTSADIDDTKKALGWEPHTNINEGLKAFAEWFKAYYNQK
jgi:UDP-glucuronate 4-epimerase